MNTRPVRYEVQMMMTMGNKRFPKYEVIDTKLDRLCFTFRNETAAKMMATRLNEKRKIKQAA